MDLISLGGVFIRPLDRTFRTFESVSVMSEAMGVMFTCPFCFGGAGGRVEHAVLCWRSAVPSTVPPTNHRWILKGSDLRDLTLVRNGGGPPPPTGECLWRIRVEGGVAEVPPEIIEAPPEPQDVNGQVITDWTLSAADIQLLQAGGRIRLKTFTFYGPLQPTLLRVIPPSERGVRPS